MISINTNIKIPEHLIRDKNQHQVDYSLIKNKTIIGLCGYAKSGKDTLANCFIEDGYKRVAFADAIKEEMNNLLREQIIEEVKNSASIYLNKTRCGDQNYAVVPFILNEPEDVRKKMIDAIESLTVDNLDCFTENLTLKKVIRPYIIWLGEKVRGINGVHTWTNRALNSVKEFDKIILSDVRRPQELDLFRNSKNLLRKTSKSFLISGYKSPKEELAEKYAIASETFLFFINQYGLRDDDILTWETIRLAQEEWLFDDTVYVDSRIPEKGKYRERFIKYQYGKLIEKLYIIT